MYVTAALVVNLHTRHLTRRVKRFIVYSWPTSGRQICLQSCVIISNYSLFDLKLTIHYTRQLCDSTSNTVKWDPSPMGRMTGLGGDSIDFRLP